MSVVIGIVVHARRFDIFEQAARTVTGVTLRWAVYHQQSEIGDRVRELLAQPRMDGVLLGLLPFELARDLLPESVVVAVPQPSALDLALAFARMRAEFPLETPVSIDTFGQEIVNEVTTALGVDATSLPYAPGQRTADIVEHHRSAMRERGGVVITMRMDVADQLRPDVPVINSSTVPSTVRADLHELVLRIHSGQANAFRFTAGIFQVRDRASEIDVEQARSGLTNLLLHNPDMAGAWVENHGRRGLVVFAHKALFERATARWRVVPILRQAEELLGISADAGFGIGGSARTSVSLAERAAARAATESEPSGFLIEDNGVIIGPMNRDQSLAEFTYRDHGAALERLARDAGLSPTTLSRLVAVERNLHGRPVAPSELAALLGITDPSGRRVIRKLQAAGLAVAEGIAQHARKGRPTRLYRLRLDDALSED
ncbi:helix-turn-helix domain-containing protein [Saccharopolyspora sp. K220]|uniref:helix-turn-helix domain-containing protein n=1 Tax=Saccharopolyspora soli TaxID=2926618 RepID=UPI001F5AC949|nr:helix-turn-helix domain-containing protein [Saccharopolyspora soli]MCI2417316.1 helix-turn-helix domain-containing protein [Saccharopolyspora soli]